MIIQTARKIPTQVADALLRLPRALKQLSVLLLDVGLCTLTVWLSFYLRIGLFLPLSGQRFWLLLLTIGLAIPLFFLFGFYRSIFRHSNWRNIIIITQVCALYGLLFSSVVTVVGMVAIPRTIGVIQPILLLLGVAGSRLVITGLLSRASGNSTPTSDMRRTLIYGAGAAGRRLASLLQSDPEIRILGYLDDDDRLFGQNLNGLKIYDPKKLERLIERYLIDDVLVAMPSVDEDRKRQVLARLSDLNVAVRIVPRLSGMAMGEDQKPALRQVQIQDLLGRSPVSPNQILLSRNGFRKCVMITGAGGSIGAELCRQVLATKPSQLLLLEANEYALYAIHRELATQAKNLDCVITPLLMSSDDASQISEAFAQFKPHIIYHAAAYKHVPLVESNPVAGIKNNVLNTLTLAQLAQTHRVPNFVLVSTDKAVRPTNVMGATKRIAEMLLQAFADAQVSAGNAPSTRFSMVRFGNVLGSSGSVVPLFEEQIAAGGPVTVTHKHVTRYFMTIAEAAQLVIQAGAMARGAEVFLLDMGEPVKIVDLARSMIRLSGHAVIEPGAENSGASHLSGIEIVYTGLRPGEKLYEELLIGDDNQDTSHPKIRQSNEAFQTWAELEPSVKALRAAALSGDTERLYTLIAFLVEGYVRNGSVSEDLASDLTS